MKKLDVELEMIKCKIHEEDLQENFKEKLENKLNNACESKEYTTIDNFNKKRNFINKPYYCYKSAAVFICFILLASCAYAGGVGDWVKEMFCNVDTGIEVAYENGDIKKIDTEYQTFDGVSIKVDYVSLKDNELYVVFNVKCDEEIRKIYNNDIIIKDSLDNVILNKTEEKDTEWKYTFKEKKVDKTNSLMFFIAQKIGSNFEDCKNLKIEIKNISIKTEKNLKEHSGEWQFNIDI